MIGVQRRLRIDKVMRRMEFIAGESISCCGTFDQLKCNIASSRKGWPIDNSDTRMRVERQELAIGSIRTAFLICAIYFEHSRWWKVVKKHKATLAKKGNDQAITCQ